METLVVLIVVIVMLVMTIKIFRQLLCYQVHVDDIDDIARKPLQSRAHCIVMQFIHAYNMPDTMEKVAAVRECKHLVEQYDRRFHAERQRIQNQATTMKNNVVWLTKSNL